MGQIGALVELLPWPFNPEHAHQSPIWYPYYITLVVFSMFPPLPQTSWRQHHSPIGLVVIPQDKVCPLLWNCYEKRQWIIFHTQHNLCLQILGGEEWGKRGWMAEFLVIYESTQPLFYSYSKLTTWSMFTFALVGRGRPALVILYLNSMDLNCTNVLNFM